MTDPTLAKLLEYVAAPMYDRQDYLKRFEQGLSWHISSSTGYVWYEDAAGIQKATHFPFHILGIEDRQARKWTWGWAIEGKFPARAANEIRRLKAYGEREELVPLRAASFALGEGETAYDWAFLAAGLLRGAFFLELSVREGRAYVMVDQRRFRRKVRDPIQRIVHLFPEILKIPGLGIRDQTRAFREHLGLYRLRAHTGPADDGGTWYEAARGAIELHALFDRNGKLEYINSSETVAAGGMPYDPTEEEYDREEPRK